MRAIVAAAAVASVACGSTPPAEPDRPVTPPTSTAEPVATVPPPSNTAPEVPGTAAPTSAPTSAPTAAATAPPATPPEGTGGCPAGMVRVAAATFKMGSDAGEPDEKPVHDVTLAAYCIDAREVTVADFKRCADAGKCVAHATAEWRGISEKDREFRSQSCNWGQSGRDNHPINCVDWRQASAYCAFAGKRLPTEEEWEYAARGKDGRTYPWGEAAPGPALLNACADECVAWAKTQGLTWKAMHAGDDKYPTTAPVGSYDAGKSPFGVHDMAGNVAEWTASGYSQDYGRARNEVNRVIRGGSARSETATLVRASNRHKNVATDRLGGIGFRCAQ